MHSNKRVDFKALQKRIPIDRVLDMLGVQAKKTGAQLQSTCPICHHDSDRCFVVTPAINRFWCFGDCQSGGDAIELVARVKEISHKEAARLLVEHFGEG